MKSDTDDYTRASEVVEYIGHHLAESMWRKFDPDIGVYMASVHKVVHDALHEVLLLGARGAEQLSVESHQDETRNYHNDLQSVMLTSSLRAEILERKRK